MEYVPAGIGRALMSSRDVSIVRGILSAVTSVVSDNTRNIRKRSRNLSVFQPPVSEWTAHSR